MVRSVHRFVQNPTEHSSVYVNSNWNLRNCMIHNSTPNEFKFRAWSQTQAERFIAHIPDLLVFDTDFKKWCESATDVIVTLQVHASIDQLRTILGGMNDMKVIDRTLADSQEFKAFSY